MPSYWRKPETRSRPPHQSLPSQSRTTSTMGRWRSMNTGKYPSSPSCRGRRCCTFFAGLLIVYAVVTTFHSWLTLIFVPMTDLESPEAACDKEFDAILVLGGGVPLKENLPPKWVQARASAAAKVYNCLSKKPVILTLSAGTAHVPQLIDSHGLPVFESASTASFLVDHEMIPAWHIVMETTSYDTIGNAYFARTSHTEIRGWTKLLVITSSSHMARTRAIFKWVFSLPLTDTFYATSSLRGAKYELSFLATPDTGLDLEEVNARKEREASSLAHLATISREIRSLDEMHKWLTFDHKLYSVRLIGDRGKEHIPEAVRKSYGSMGKNL